MCPPNEDQNWMEEWEDDLYHPWENSLFLRNSPSLAKQLTQSPALGSLYSLINEPCKSCPDTLAEKGKWQDYVRLMSRELSQAQTRNANSKKKLSNLRARSQKQKESVQVVEGELAKLRREIEEGKEKLKRLEEEKLKKLEEEKKRRKRAVYYYRHGLFLSSGEECRVCLSTLQYESREDLHTHILRRAEKYGEEIMCNICQTKWTTWKEYRGHATVHGIELADIIS